MGIQNIEKHGPYPFNAGAVKHLRTDISFDIGKNKAIDIANIIHPSPANHGEANDWNPITGNRYAAGS